MMETSKSERLQKILASAGIGSRRYCERLIVEGRVTVDGKQIDSLGTKADPEHSKITVDGKPLGTMEVCLTLMLNKPVGVVTTLSDPQGRPSIKDCIPKEYAALRLYPVGRLDMDTSGLLLLTNDGDLAYRVMHPKHEVTKWYQAEVTGTLKEQTLQRLRTGVLLDDGLTAPAEVQVQGQRENRTVVLIGIREGRNRQVRRMFAAVKCRVVFLKRLAIGPLKLGDLGKGECRPLSNQELDELTRVLQED
ncbi:MAG TPA: pseudouridine synthase [bacterium]|nr:pseudouridine synthase [bacterium]